MGQCERTRSAQTDRPCGLGKSGRLFSPCPGESSAGCTAGSSSTFSEPVKSSQPSTAYCSAGSMQCFGERKLDAGRAGQGRARVPAGRGLPLGSRRAGGADGAGGGGHTLAAVTCSLKWKVCLPPVCARPAPFTGALCAVQSQIPVATSSRSQPPPTASLLPSPLMSSVAATFPPAPTAPALPPAPASAPDPVPSTASIVSGGGPSGLAAVCSSW